MLKISSNGNFPHILFAQLNDKRYICIIKITINIKNITIMTATNKIRERVVKILSKHNNLKDVEAMMNKHFDYVMEAHKGATPSQKAEVIVTLWAYCD